MEHCEHEIKVDRRAARRRGVSSTAAALHAAADAPHESGEIISRHRRLFSSREEPGDCGVFSVTSTQIVAIAAAAACCFCAQFWVSGQAEKGDQDDASLGIGGRGCFSTWNHRALLLPTLAMSVRLADSKLGGAQRRGGVICHRHTSRLAGWRLTRLASATALLLCLTQLPTVVLSQSPTESPDAAAGTLTTAPVAQPGTAGPATAALATAAPATATPSTAAPVTAAPVTAAPVTAAPVTAAPVAPPETVAPTIAPIPEPTVNETSSPTLRPTISPTQPLTAPPTISKKPTFSPTVTPTVSPRPTVSPTERPTDDPTLSPTLAPTDEPTLIIESKENGFYQQDIIISEEEPFNTLQQLIFADLYQSYTPFYGPGLDEVDPEEVESTIETVCTITDQSLLDAPLVTSRGPRWLRLGTKWHNSGYFSSAPQYRALQDEEDGGGGEEEEGEEPIEPPEPTTWKLRVTFTMSWRSRYISVTGYADEFPAFINGNLTTVTQDMITSGLKTVVQAQEIFKEQKTPPPSPAPTSASPSAAPSPHPSAFPTEHPTTAQPSFAPPPPSPEGLSAGAIGAIVAGGGAAALIIAYFLYRSRKQRIEEARQRTARSKKGGHGKRGKSQDWSSRPPSNIPVENVDIAAPLEGANAASPGGPFAYMPGHNDPEANDEDGGHIPPNDSLVSNQSLISAGLSMSSGSDQEADTRDHLADEFDQYKDQNLEKMRTEVEGTVTNVDGMMSQALTKALMDDDDSQRDMNELRWGGSGNSMEIEASVLCEMNDWLKRKEGASIDERRAFMQETLNKMVASVRHGVVSPEDASRTIHECAAMLGLQLAETIPETALIVTGMRKMVKSEDVMEAFKEFGEIEDAAVSPNARGFGLVRFVSPKSVLRAMEKFRKEEIVVQDVAVMIKVLKSEDMDMAALGPPSEADMSRQFSGGQGRPLPMSTGPARSTSASSSRAMEAHHGPNLDTIGYPGESIGRGQDGRGGPRYPVHTHGPGSDTGSGASRGSRKSNRSSQGHKRNQSGEDTNGTGRRVPSRT